MHGHKWCGRACRPGSALVGHYGGPSVSTGGVVVVCRAGGTRVLLLLLKFIGMKSSSSSMVAVPQCLIRTARNGWLRSWPKVILRRVPEMMRQSMVATPLSEILLIPRMALLQLLEPMLPLLMTLLLQLLLLLMLQPLLLLLLRLHR